MKTFLIYFILIFSSFCFSQTKRFSLQLKTDDKTSFHGTSFWTEAFISSKDTSFYYKLHSLRADKIE
ncbi:MAG: hypothetical protein IAF38_22970, partial [Bacteroidia bacterium]|nr:hypothetical protein [Bacteroidia bacterium]